MMSPFPLGLPAEIGRRLAGAVCKRVNAGRSGAEVYAFDNGLYLKSVLRNPVDDVFGNLEGEFRRLGALSGRIPVPVPEVFARDPERDCLLMTELWGQDAGSIAAGSDRARAMAAACHLLHQADADSFPFVERVDALVEQARRRLELGLVDASDFDQERAGKSPNELFEELCRLAPDDGEPVLTHGDLCLPNVIVQESRVVGFVDVGRAAIADRWRDLALCIRSLELDCGDAASEEFLRVYGAVRDQRKLAFYTLLDEFF